MRTLKDKAETLAQAARNLYGTTCDDSYSPAEVMRHVEWTEIALRDVRRVVRAQVTKARRAACAHGEPSWRGRCRRCGKMLATVVANE